MEDTIWTGLLILAIIIAVEVNGCIQENKRKKYEQAKKRNKPVTFENSVISRRV